MTEEALREITLRAPAAAKVLSADVAQLVHEVLRLWIVVAAMRLRCGDDEVDTAERLAKALMAGVAEKEAPADG